MESVSDYVRARRTQGVSDISLMFGDVLPNCLSVVTVWATLLTAGGVFGRGGFEFCWTRNCNHLRPLGA